MKIILCRCVVDGRDVNRTPVEDWEQAATWAQDMWAKAVKGEFAEPKAQPQVLQFSIEVRDN